MDFEDKDAIKFNTDRDDKILKRRNNNEIHN